MRAFNINLMWFVYIIRCENDSFYVGATDNPVRRFQEHKQGRGGRYTRSFKPEKIVYIEQYSTKVEAL